MRRNRDNLFDNMVDQETVPSYFQPQPSLMELEARRQAIGQKAEPMSSATPGDFNFRGVALKDPTQKQSSEVGLTSSYANQLNSNIPDNSNTGSTTLEAPKYSTVTQQDIDRTKADDLKPSENEAEESDKEGNAFEAFADALSKRPKFQQQSIQAVDYGDVGAGVDMRPISDMQARREAIMKMMGRG
jgi:hypothetical protein